MYVASQVYGFASHVWFNLGHVLTVVAMRRPTASRGATLRAATVALLRGGIAKNRAAMASARTRPTRSPLPPLYLLQRPTRCLRLTQKESPLNAFPNEFTSLRLAL